MQSIDFRARAVGLATESEIKVWRGIVEGTPNVNRREHGNRTLGLSPNVELLFKKILNIV